MSFSLPKVAILDLYNGIANLGMKNIIHLIHSVGLEYDVYDVRAKNEIPDIEKYDIYISTGGPGSPYDGEGLRWENDYFYLIDEIWNHNQQSENKKYVFFICHSFQMMVRYFNLGEIYKRRSMSFGIFPVHKTEAGETDPLFKNLADPFMVADFRYYQMIHPNMANIEGLGGSILALEKIRPQVSLDRAIMAMRISPEFIGTQFHPEANPEGMRIYYSHPEKRIEIIKQHGEGKYDGIMDLLDDKDSDSIQTTYDYLLPTFLIQAKNQVMKNSLELV